MTDSPAPAAAPPASAEPPIVVKLIGYAIGALFVFSFISAIQGVSEFVSKWWPYFAVGAALVVIALLIVVLMPSGRRWLNESKPTTRAGFFIFIVLPLLTLPVAGVSLLSPPYQPAALRSVFLVVVCLLPATMWYLFLVTRKASLLNEFLANLDRLGLLHSAQNEDETARARRVQSYLQKFEAIYGDLSPEIYTDVLQNRIAPYSRVTSGATTLSTATVPVMLSTVLITLGWLMTLPPIEDGLDTWVNALKLEDAPIKFAFLGAYFFSLQMLFRRYVLKDLGGSAYVAVSIRIILAVIGTWVIMSIKLFEDEKHILIAGFIFGVFPRVVWQVIASIFKRVAGYAVPSMVSQLPVSDLDGLTVWHEARLEEEDIENIPNMATADLVELLLNTRLPPERIIDWTDQAILYTQLGPQEQKQGELSARERLRSYGIRTATSLFRVSAAVDGESFSKILMLNGESVMPTLKSSLSTNSNLELIQLWRGASSG